MNFPFRISLAILALWAGVFAINLFAEETPAGTKKTVPADHVERAKKGTALFKSQVRGILAKHCLDCHGGNSVKADFDLSTRKKLMDSGYVEDTAENSYLMKLITHAEEPHMPLKAARLPAASIEHIRQWIDLGAPYDKPLVEGKPDDAKSLAVTEHDRAFWAFQPLQEVPIPEVKNAAWCRTPIDRFILARQEAAGLRPNTEADKRTLLRRATFDLLGLPATPEEVEAFRTDTDPDAWPRVVDQLLKSDHYGERWARHWMDVARFAESHGYEQDYDRPHAYHYRDFLIKAFNRDMPFDQFVKWQLAGDELAPENPLAWMATGFLGAGAFPTQLTEAEFESARYDELDDMVTTTGVAFLGLSVGCARCHDHKFDPIPARDYYRMAATFTTAIRSEIDFDLHPEENKQKQLAFDAKHSELQQALKQFEQQQLPKQFADWLANYDPKTKAAAGGNDIDPKIQSALAEAKASGDRNANAWKTAQAWFAKTLPEWQRLNSELVKHREKGSELKLTKVMVTSEGVPHMKHHADGRGFPHFYPQTHFLLRGDVQQKQDIVTHGFLQVLTPEEMEEDHWRMTPPESSSTSFRRATLANWMTDTEHGAGALVARVIVNRVWQHHFGRGLVATPNDFGVSGERPSHPELLEWLANDLVEHGWQLKRLHRLILTSSIYLQSADHDEDRAKIDRENTLLWRWSPRRLEAEAIRDALLAVSGKLDRTMYGPGTLDQNMTRRSVYFFIKRSQLIPMMMLFDWPEHLVSIGQRSSTTIAPQALMFLNSPQGRQYAQAFASRLPQDSSEATIQEAYRLAFARTPTEQEVKLMSAFLQQQEAVYEKQKITAPQSAALTDLCQALMSTNEFIYIE